MITNACYSVLNLWVKYNSLDLTKPALMYVLLVWSQSMRMVSLAINSCRRQRTQGSTVLRKWIVLLRRGVRWRSQASMHRSVGGSHSCTRCSWAPSSPDIIEIDPCSITPSTWDRLFDLRVGEWSVWWSTLTDPSNLDMGCINVYIHGIYIYIHLNSRTWLYINVHARIYHVHTRIYMVYT